MDTDIDSVAIIGMAVRVPGAANVEQFWRNLVDGRNSIRFPTDEELIAAGVPPQALGDSRYVKAVAQAPDVESFDAEFFGMTPREAQICDPQIRMFLEAAHSAIENSGYDVGRLTDVGVFGAAGVNRYLHLHVQPAANTLRSLTELSLGTWNNADSLATLVSYKLNLTGPSMTVQTACSSSLTAVHQAVNAIRMGECDVALAGGVEIEFPVGHGYWWTPDGPLSRDGYCRPFDAAATGTVFGSGVAVVVLKRLSQALADGDRVRAVIRATAVNNDGASKMGFTAPSVEGQSKVIVEAIGMAGVEPSAISLIEAHGTGTVLGDPIEVAALKHAFARFGATGSAAPWCTIGSVKANIGHLGHAAGAASLIKAVLCLENERIPPAVNLERINPELGLDGSPFQLTREPLDWPRVSGQPRLAGVSSLGVGGTNVHVVLEEGPPVRPGPIDGDPRILIWSAKTAEAADAYRDKLAAFLQDHGEREFAAAASTLQHGRTGHRYRAALVSASAAEAVAALASMDAKAVRAIPADGPRDVVFLFPGQGAQHAGMAFDLYRHEPTFAAVLDEVFDLFAALGTPVADAWRSADADSELLDTVIAQPLLFAVEYALARMWQSWGVTPACLLGHSIGELTAAAVAGVFELPDAVTLVAARARAMARMPAGAMLAVAAPADEIVPLLPEQLTLAVDNGPRQCVVAGTVEDIETFERYQRELGQSVRRVPTSHAFHCTAMAPAAAEFEQVLRTVAARPPKLPILSAATGRAMTAEQAVDPEFWAAQLVQPVRFGAALEGLLAAAPRVVLEVGPSRTLTALVRSHPAGRDDRHLVLATLPARRSDPPADRRSARQALAALWVEGHEANWSAVMSGETVRRVPMPGYQYRRSRHWLDPQPANVPVATPGGLAGDGGTSTTTGSPAPRATAATPFSLVDWMAQPVVDAPEPAGKVDALALLPADDVRSRDLVAALNRAGVRLLAVPERFRTSGTGVFHLEPDRFADLPEILQALADEGRHPQLLVHGWTLADSDDDGASMSTCVERNFHSVVEAVRLGARTASQNRPSLLVLTTRSADVSGSEAVDPANAVLHPLVQTIASEDPAISAKLIDLPDRVSEDVLVAELARWRESAVVALRGHRRWVRTETPYRPVPAADAGLRPGGVYVITGGTGGLGLSVAKALAGTGMRPYLVLLSRHGRAPEAKLAEIRALGAEVQVTACDVSDAAALGAVIDQIAGSRGPVAGVFHLAGVRGSGMVQFGDRKGPVETFRPKVAGALAIEEVFAKRSPLDFLVFFSSRAALEGQPGGADYAAANAFLDSFIQTCDLPARRMVSIDWPAWDAVGMAVAPALPADAAAGAVRWQRVISARDEPVIDEHRLDGVPVVPGTSHLDFVVSAFREAIQSGVRAPVQLTDVVFQKMMTLAEARRLEVLFEPDADGYHRFTVASAPPMDTSPEALLIHVRGRIRQVAAQPRTADLAALRRRLPDVHTPTPEPAGVNAFTLGPRWQTITEFHRGVPGEQLLTLELPAPFTDEVAGHALHPSLLDGATTSARDNEHEDIHMPFMYRSMLVYDSLPAQFFSYIRRRPGAANMIVADLDVIGPDGRVLVEIEGFSMRRAPEAANLIRTTEPESGRFKRPVRQDGIPPELGGELLLTLLRSRTPRQVAVNRYRDGAFESASVEVPEPSAARTVTAAAPDPAAGPATAAPAAVTTIPATASAQISSAPPSAGGEDVAERLRAIWVEALGIPDVDPGSDFFELGGNSLTAIELMSVIRERLGVDLSIAAVFDHPTLADLGAEIRRRLA
ncbi:MAG TPA: SDR family NAD(P)-dependent oxidoreductase [Micromonosporaceae bacterium]